VGNELKDRYPRILVIASPAMRDSYNRFGDMISFDVTHNLLRNIIHDNHRFRVAIFTVGTLTNASSSPDLPS
jgi:hypothetical protein